MPFKIIRNDITKVAADAIVNTANPDVGYGTGTDAAVYKAAGEEQLLAARSQIGRIDPGEAVYTPAFALPAKYIIHTVGPSWNGGGQGEFAILRSCYRESLLLANRLGCKSIAFPLIAAGNYGFPKPEALRIALGEISDFLKISEMEVTLVVFDKKAFDLSAVLSENVRQYIDDNYVKETIRAEYSKAGGPHDLTGRRAARGTLQYSVPEASESYSAPMQSGRMEPELYEDQPLARIEHDDNRELSEEEFDAYFDSLYESSRPDAPGTSPYDVSLKQKSSSLQDIMSRLGETFQERLLDLIDERGFSDTQVYKKANIDRKLFSKIRCNPNYKPSKTTALSLAVALELSLDETVDLLSRAGLALSPSSKFDLIVRYCLKRGIYDVYEINAILFDYDQQLLGC